MEKLTKWEQMRSHQIDWKYSQVLWVRNKKVEVHLYCKRVGGVLTHLFWVFGQLFFWFCLRLFLSAFLLNGSSYLLSGAVSCFSQFCPIFFLLCFLLFCQALSVAFRYLYCSVYLCTGCCNCAVEVSTEVACRFMSDWAVSKLTVDVLWNKCYWKLSWICARYTNKNGPNRFDATCSLFAKEGKWHQKRQEKPLFSHDCCFFLQTMMISNCISIHNRCTNPC